MTPRGEADVRAGCRCRFNFDAGDHAALPDVDDGCQISQAAQKRCEEGNFILQQLKDTIFPKHLQTGQRRRAPKLAGGVAVAIKKSPPLARVAEEAIEYALSGQRGCQREIAARDSLRKTEEVRNHVFVFTGEHFSGATETGHDFIENQIDIALPAPALEMLEHSLRP